MTQAGTQRPTPDPRAPLIVGVVSDTHGYFDPRLPAVLTGVDAILHAGDVGSEEVLRRLAELAPLHAVQGNNDVPLGGLGLPVHLDVWLGGRLVHVVHELPAAQPLPDTEVIVCGHSHRPLVERRDRRLLLNPGAAGRRGFHAVQTVALLRLSNDGVEASIVELGPRLGSRPAGNQGSRAPLGEEARPCTA